MSYSIDGFVLLQQFQPLPDALTGVNMDFALTGEQVFRSELQKCSLKDKL